MRAEEIRFGPGPMDKVQILEKAIEEGVLLQGLYDEGHDIQDIAELGEFVDIGPLWEEPVTILGGEVETFSMIGQNEVRRAFLANDEEGQTGKYLGMEWRNSLVEVLPGEEIEVNRLCHMLRGESDEYPDELGNVVSIQKRTYVTVEGSEPVFLSELSGHDFRRLRHDGFTMDLDVIAMDDTRNLQEKADVIAKMFYVPDISILTEQFHQVRAQRFSYLNWLDIFEAAQVISPYCINRTTESGNILAVPKIEFAPEYMSHDMSINDNGEINDDKESVLSFEIELSEFNRYSIPYIPGRTVVQEG